MYYQQFGEYGSSFLETARSIALNLSDPVEFGRGVLDDMVNNVLIRKAAEERGITVSEEEIDEAIQVAFGFFPDGTPTPTLTATTMSTPTLSETQLALVTQTSTATATELPTETPEPSLTPSEVSENETNEADPSDDVVVNESEDVDETIPDESAATPTIQLSPTITLTPTPYTTKVFGENIKEFNDLYSLYKFNEKDLRKLIEVDLLREKLIAEVITDEQPFEDEVWARHILVETEEDAQEIIEKLEDGGDFHQLAAEFSTDESNKDKGGDLGWFNDSTMVEEFTEAAFNLEIGEISEPVQTTYGYHIIQALGTRESQISDFELEQNKQAAFTDWLTVEQKMNHKVTIFEEWEEYVPTTPEVPQQLLMELYQQ